MRGESRHDLNLNETTALTKWPLDLVASARRDEMVAVSFVPRAVLGTVSDSGK